MRKLISHSSERELHFLGDYAVVAWNVDLVGDKWVRSGPPHIDLTYVHGDEDPTDIREDSDQIRDGWDVAKAQQIHRELGVAIAYLKSLEADNDEPEAEEKVELKTVVVKGFEQHKVYEVGQGYLAIRISELDEDVQAPLRRFMRGQTQVLIVGYPMGDFVYLHDFENFRASGKLFWD